MEIKQISLFLENKPGHLKMICSTLADAQISIRNLSLADTQQFGIVRIIVKDVDKAKEVLEKAGHIVNVREVLAVSVPDRPGGIAAVLDAIHKSGCPNIEYMYAFAGIHASKEAVLIFRFEDIEHAKKLFKDADFKLLSFDQLFD